MTWPSTKPLTWSVARVLSSCGGSLASRERDGAGERVDGFGQRAAAAGELRQPAEQHCEHDEREDAEEGKESELPAGGARERVAAVGDDVAHVTLDRPTERFAAGYRLSAPNA